MCERAHNSGIGRAAQRSTTPGFFNPVVIRARYVTAHTIEPTSTTAQCTSVVTQPKNSTIGRRTMKWVTRKLFQSGPAYQGFGSPDRSSGCCAASRVVEKQPKHRSLYNEHSTGARSTHQWQSYFQARTHALKSLACFRCTAVEDYNDFSRCERAQRLLRISMVSQTNSTVV